MRISVRIVLMQLIALFVMNASVNGQESAGLYSRAYHLPDKLFGAIDKKSQGLQERLESSTKKYLARLERRERKLQQRLARKDSAAAKKIFGDLNNVYSDLEGRLSDSARGNDALQQLYSSRLDSMKTVFGFLQANKLLGETPAAQAKLSGTIKNYDQLQLKLNQTDVIRKAITERKDYLQKSLEPFGMGKQLGKYKAQVYYYREQLDAYKNILEDPDKLEAKLLSAASHIPAFRSFFNRYSQLGSLFRLPGADDMAAVSVPGLQTRDLLMQELGQRFGAGFNPQQSIGQGITAATSQLDKLRNKLNGLGENGQDLDMPDFKANNEKSKSFLKRLEFGANVQSTKSSMFFPSASDIGLSVGYKLSSKAVAGVGASYKVGWGRDIRHIRVTNEGIGLRTFVDIKMKGSLWITGGGELNYRWGFSGFDILKDFSPWQKSALLGLSKKARLKKMNGNVQVLYDFLWRQQVPAGQPVVFRVGYQL